MILYFNNKRINNDWKKIEFTLEKIKREKVLQLRVLRVRQ